MPGSKAIFKGIMNFHDMTCMATPYHKNPWPVGHDIYNFSRPFLSQHDYIPSLSDQCMGVEKKTLKNTSILHFLSPNYLPFGFGS